MKICTKCHIPKDETEFTNILPRLKPWAFALEDRKIGIKGVSKSGNNYTANMMLNRKHIYLGSFSTIEEAARAYNRAAILYHGEYARLNVFGT